MAKVAFIIPLHPIKASTFEHTLRSIEKFDSHSEFDIFLVISFTNELSQFQNLINLYPRTKKIIQFIVLDQQFNRETLLQSIENRSIITFKKYYGLAKLSKANYKYLWTLDADFILLRNIGFILESKLYCNEKMVLGSGNGHTTIAKVNQASWDLLQIPKEPQIDLSLYFWFSNPCIYRDDLARQFLNFIEFENKIDKYITELDWHVFDYVPYIYYCMVHHKYQLVNYSHALMFQQPAPWSLESCDFETWRACNRDLQRLRWIRKRLYYQNQDEVDNLSNVLLSFHIDRE